MSIKHLLKRKSFSLTLKRCGVNDLFGRWWQTVAALTNHHKNSYCIPGQT